MLVLIICLINRQFQCERGVDLHKSIPYEIELCIKDVGLKNTIMYISPHMTSLVLKFALDTLLSHFVN